MQSYRHEGTVIFVSNRPPDATIAQDMQLHGLEMHWAPTIIAAGEMLAAPSKKTVIVTELAVADGNWRDLIERVNTMDITLMIPIVLVTSSGTAELWWDALECGVDDILPGGRMASRLREILER